MKFAHIADLHIGKRVNDFSMLEEQRYIFKEIIEIIRHEDADAVLVAGDIYDKSQPSAEAVALCDDFFYSLSGLDKDIFIISGNHDCPERIAYGARLLENTKFHIAPVFNGEMKRTELFDEFGKVNVYMLPFVKPVGVRKYIGPADNYTQAVKAVIDKADINQEERNILVAHQFVTGALRCDSEELTVGTLDNVDATVFDKFDYVALGHIHSPQNLGDPHIRYAGTPLKYSVSEADQNKSITVVEMGKKGEISYRYLPIHPLYDVRALRGKMEELAAQCIEIPCHDYVSIVLTDEEAVQQPRDYLEKYYDHILEIQIDNTRTRQIMEEEIPALKEMSLEGAFMTFFKESTGRPMNEDEQKKFAQIIETL